LTGHFALDRYCSSSHNDAAPGRDIDRQAAGPAHDLPLANENRRRHPEQRGVAKVSAKRSSGRAGRGVFYHAPDRKRIARMKHEFALAPNQLQSGQILTKHHCFQPFEVVIELTQPARFRGRQHQMPRAGVCPRGWYGPIELVMAPVERCKRLREQVFGHRGMLRLDRRQGCLPEAVPGTHRNRYLADGGFECVTAVTLKFAKSDTRRNGGMTTERYFCFRAEIANRPRWPGRRRYEGGLGEPDTRSDALHDARLRQRLADPDAGWIAAVAAIGKSGEAIQSS